jgi:hypothetical protein
MRSAVDELSWRFDQGAVPAKDRATTPKHGALCDPCAAAGWPRAAATGADGHDSVTT